MDKVWLLLRFLRDTKTNNFMAHLQCLQELCALFFAMDHQNYARYASACLFSLINLPHSHPGADDLLNNRASVFLGHRFQHQELLLTYQSNKLSIGRQSPKVALSTLAEICRHIIAGVSPDTRELHTWMQLSNLSIWTRETTPLTRKKDHRKCRKVKQRFSMCIQQ